MAELIKTTDSLNDGRKKLNDAITDSNAALSTANNAEKTANLAKAESESTQTQLDTIVIEGDSSVEAAQARVNNSGTAFPTLKQRLDAEHQEVTAQLQQTEGYNAFDISKTKGDLSELFCQDGGNVVLTGDSLSFNHHPFGFSTSNNAYGDSPGLLSWSHQLRDAIHRNDLFFVPADELNLKIESTNYTVEKYAGIGNRYAWAFSGNIIMPSLLIENSSNGVSLFYKHENKATGKAVIYVSRLISSLAGKFDVYVDNDLKKANVDIGGEVTRYRGNAIMTIEVDVPADNKTHEITFKNFGNSDSLSAAPNTDNMRAIVFYGVGTKNTNTYLTGTGGWTAGDLLSNINDRILQYNPDFVGIIIGANDVYKKTPLETFKANLTSVLSQIKNQNQNSNILLMTGTSMRDETGEYTNPLLTPDEVSKNYYDIMGKLAIEYNCHFINVMKLFENLPVSQWRHDNVHLNKFGCSMLGKNVLNTLMPNGMYNKKYLDADFYYENKLETRNLLPLSNGWLNFGSGYAELQYKIDGNTVNVFGVIKSGTVAPSTLIANLPKSIAPKQKVFKQVTSYDTTNNVLTGMVILDPVGQILCSLNISNNALFFDFSYVI